MGFVDAVRHALTHYAQLKGRARRSEYWNFVLFCLLLGVVCSILDVLLKTYVRIGGTIGIPLLTTLASLALTIPQICCLVRRLHDIGKSGLWYFLAFIPLVGSIIILIWLCRDSDAGTNRFGPSPKQVSKQASKQVSKQVSKQAAEQCVGDKATSVVSSRDAVQVPADTLRDGVVEPVAPENAPLVPGAGDGGRMCLGLVALSGPLQGQAYSLEGQDSVFGRDAACSVRFPQATPGVSARHCQITMESGSPVLVDLDSSYGTYVGDGRRVGKDERVRLAEGDEFWLGANDNRFKVIVFRA